MGFPQTPPLHLHGHKGVGVDARNSQVSWSAGISLTRRTHRETTPTRNPGQGGGQVRLLALPPVCPQQVPLRGPPAHAHCCSASILRQVLVPGFLHQTAEQGARARAEISKMTGENTRQAGVRSSVDGCPAHGIPPRSTPAPRKTENRKESKTRMT